MYEDVLLFDVIQDFYYCWDKKGKPSCDILNDKCDVWNDDIQKFENKYCWYPPAQRTVGCHEPCGKYKNLYQ